MLKSGNKNYKIICVKYMRQKDNIRKTKIKGCSLHFLHYFGEKKKTCGAQSYLFSLRDFFDLPNVNSNHFLCTFSRTFLSRLNFSPNKHTGNELQLINYIVGSDYHVLNFYINFSLLVDLLII